MVANESEALIFTCVLEHNISSEFGLWPACLVWSNSVQQQSKKTETEMM